MLGINTTTDAVTLAVGLALGYYFAAHFLRTKSAV